MLYAIVNNELPPADQATWLLMTCRYKEVMAFSIFFKAINHTPIVLWKTTGVWFYQSASILQLPVV